MNRKLLKMVRDQVVQHPETHSQDMWTDITDCGTTACVAGWACILSGDLPLWEEGYFDTIRSQEGENWTIPHRAQMLLKLDEDQATRLFYETSNDAAIKLLNEWIESPES